MSSKVSVEFTAFGYGDHKPGDRADLDPAEAKKVIRSGHAVAAKVSDAKAVGADPESAASKRAK